MCFLNVTKKNPKRHHHPNGNRIKKSVTKMFIYVATSRVKNRRKKINLNLCRRRNALEKKRKQTFTHTHSLITIQILTITKSETNGVT